MPSRNQAHTFLSTVFLSYEYRMAATPGIRSVTRQEREVQMSQTPKGRVSQISQAFPEVPSGYIYLGIIARTPSHGSLDQLLEESQGERVLWMAVQLYHHTQRASFMTQSIETRVSVFGAHHWLIMSASELWHLFRD